MPRKQSYTSEQIDEVFKLFHQGLTGEQAAKAVGVPISRARKELAKVYHNGVIPNKFN